MLILTHLLSYAIVRPYTFNVGFCLFCFVCLFICLLDTCSYFLFYFLLQFFLSVPSGGR